jgi:cytochrome c oxidase cbb3-type subunit 3/ubiquinol-cytochrome c reductase cytochrome c subunit
MVITQGHGTLMPGFSKTPYGGIEPDGITALAKGMKTFWNGMPGQVQSQGTGTLPTYAYTADAGDASTGAGSFATFCGSCHGSNGTGKEDAAGSVVDESYLLLVSDQALRSTVLFGRIDLGCPSYLGPYPGQPKDRSLTLGEIDDITAWLVSQRVSYTREATQ